MKRLLYIGHVWPEPRSSAAGGRVLSILAAFERDDWHITFASAAEPGPRSEGLDGLVDETASIVLNDASFDGFVRSAAPDVVIFDRFMIEEQFGWRVEAECPDALRVLDSVDLHCLRRVRGASKPAGRDQASNAGPHDQQLRDALLRSDDAKREIASVLRSDLTLVISRFELGLLTQCFSVPQRLLHYVPFMLEADPSRAMPSFEARSNFATIGNFMHAPNADSVRWLHDEIWPLLRKRLPQAELLVYGAYTPTAIERLDNAATGFRVKGWAPDALAALSQARVCLAPLRFGAGLKGKIADAMSAGTPTVTTPVGAEAMHSCETHTARAFENWPGAIADDPRAIADAAAALHDDCDRWQRAQRLGFDLIAECFDEKAHSRDLLAAIDDARTHCQARRDENFTGAMLRHHHHRATEFMARWIEAKNRSS